MNTIDILTAALAARKDELLGYQINIDNFRLAIEHIAGMHTEDRVELDGFSKELQERLRTERHQQKKTRVIHDVIEAQLRALGTI